MTEQCSESDSSHSRVRRVAAGSPGSSSLRTRTGSGDAVKASRAGLNGNAAPIVGPFRDVISNRI